MLVLKVYYILWFVMSIISLCFYKKWGKSLVATTLLVSFMVCVIQTHYTDFPDYQIGGQVATIVLIILSYFFMGFFIYRCLLQQKNLIILKESFFIKAIGVNCILIVIPSVITYIKSLNIPVTNSTDGTGTNFAFAILDMIYQYGLLIVIAPVFEEILFREIIFKLIIQKKSKKLKFTLFILIALFFSILHFKKTLLTFLWVWFLFIGLYFIRYKFSSNKYFPIVFLIHGFYNCLCLCISLFNIK